MSTKVVAWVFYHSEASGNDRLVLLAIADEANDDGSNAFPSTTTIGRKARVNERTARRCIERLEAGGELFVLRPVVRGRGHYNRYVVLMGRPPEDGHSVLLSAEEQRGAGTEKRGGTRRTPTQIVVDPLTPTSKEVDPPTTDAAVVAARPTRLPDEFVITAPMWTWALDEQHYDKAWVTEQTHAFCDYWRARPGPGATKLDWVATWRNWLRRAATRPPSYNGARLTREQEATAARMRAYEKAKAIYDTGPSEPTHSRGAGDVAAADVG